MAPAERARARDPSPYRVVALGALLAPALAFVPLLQYVGWFLASLVHEIGHCIVAWTFGSPAYPAIRIDGHAAAIHGEQRTFLLVVVWLVLAGVTWHIRGRPILRVLMATLLVLHPLLALSEGHEVLHLLAGHATELAFAVLAFHRAFRSGGREGWLDGHSESVAERITYAAVAWFLLGKNIVMNAGIMLSVEARQAYLGNGSFGLEQDYLRAARELGCSLSTVGALMLLLSLALIPLLYAMARGSGRPRSGSLAEEPVGRHARGTASRGTASRGTASRGTASRGADSIRSLSRG